LISFCLKAKTRSPNLYDGSGLHIHVPDISSSDLMPEHDEAYTTTSLVDMGPLIHPESLRDESLCSQATLPCTDYRFLRIPLWRMPSYT
jgi:hypothetical protein